tara:strand:- start:122 stop:790 length:669 start_codon:yes stop_codon:yes gene_type:complete
MAYKEIIDILNSTYGKNIDDDATSDDLIQHLENVYNNTTDDAINKYNIFKKNKSLNSLSNYKNNLSDDIETMHNDAMTNKRLIEIKLNKGYRLEYIINILKICLIIAGCMVVFPILNKLSILNKNTTFIIWSICTLIMILVILYYVYIHINNRDRNNFNKFNFQNPDAESIAKSKINVDLSEKDYARCKAFEESKTEYDPVSVNNFSIDDYITSNQDGKCQS